MSHAIPGGSLVDGSGTLAAGATAEDVFAANKGRQYLLVQNNSAGDLWVNFGSDAVQTQPSIKLVSGASVEFSAAGTGVVPTARVSIIGATLGQAYTAKES